MNTNPIRVHDQIVEQLPAALYIPPDALRVQLHDFEGPLDLLLFLVRKHRFDILNIPMATICRQYIIYMEQIIDNNLETVSDYLTMSALLIEIKTKLLLPAPVLEEDEGDPRADLVRQLLEYERIKNVAENLGQLPKRHYDFTSPYIAVEIKNTNHKPTVTPEQISQTFATLINRLKVRKSYTFIPEFVSIRSVMADILRFLSLKKRFSFLQFAKPQQGGIAFMALLQMQLNQLVRLHQPEDGEELFIEQPTPRP